MAKLPIYTRQQVTRGARSSAADFGAGAAQEMGQMGNVMSALGEKTRMRHEVISRVRTQNSFDAMVTESANTLINGADLTDPQVLNEWQGETKGKIEEMISQHAGSEQSKLQLRSTLENQFGQYQKMLLGEQIKAQHKLIGNEIDFYNRDHAAELNFAPELWEQSMNDALTKHDADYGQILNPDVMTAYRNSTIKTYALAAANSYLQNKDPESAKLIMDDPRVQKALTADESRTLAKNIIVEQAKGANLKLRNERLVGMLEFVTGRKLTDEEIAAVNNLPEQDDMTFVDTAGLARITLNRELSPAEMQKAAGINLSSTSQSGLFGNSITGRYNNIINQNVDAFANGIIEDGSPEYNNFMTAVVNGYTKREKDQQSGMYETVVLPMPPHLKKALDARGVNFEQIAGVYQTSFNQPTTAGSPIQSQMPQQAAPGSAESPRQTIEVIPQGTPDDYPTIWEMSDAVVGPIPSVQQLAGKTPILGDITGGGGKATQYRQYLDNEVNSLVRVFQLSPRFAEGERQQLKQELDISGKAFDTVASYQQRLIAIDQSLENRYQEALNVAQDPAVGAKVRNANAERVGAILKFRQRLGIPPVVKTQADLDKVPANGWYRYNGELFQNLPE